MNPDDFKNSPSGRLVATIDKSFAFVPNPLPPPNLDLARLAVPLATAMHAIGELSGIGRSVPQSGFIGASLLARGGRGVVKDRRNGDFDARALDVRTEPG